MSETKHVKYLINQWITDNYPDITLPGDNSLDHSAMLKYYEHAEIAMIEMNLLDLYPEHLRTIRRAKYKLARLDDLEYKKEIFRSRVAF